MSCQQDCYLCLHGGKGIAFVQCLDERLAWKLENFWNCDSSSATICIHVIQLDTESIRASDYNLWNMPPVYPPHCISSAPILMETTYVSHQNRDCPFCVCVPYISPRLCRCRFFPIIRLCLKLTTSERPCLAIPSEWISFFSFLSERHMCTLPSTYSNLLLLYLSLPLNE